MTWIPCPAARVPPATPDRLVKLACAPAASVVQSLYAGRDHAAHDEYYGQTVSTHQTCSPSLTGVGTAPRATCVMCGTAVLNPGGARDSAPRSQTEHAVSRQRCRADMHEDDHTPAGRGASSPGPAGSMRAS